MPFLTPPFGIADRVDAVFLYIFVLCVAFLIWLALSRWGAIKLGAPEDEPEFSNYTWAAMIFCAGMGIAIVYWAFIEPVYYMNTSILHVDPESQKGMIGELAGMYGQFHWGITPWALYTLPAIPVAYAIHVKRVPALRMSTASTSSMPINIWPVLRGWMLNATESADTECALLR